MRGYLILFVLVMGCSRGGNEQPSSTLLFDDNTRNELVAEFRVFFQKHSLDPWYPASIDSQFGGYLTRFNHRWEPEDPQMKMLVTQSRLVWTASHASAYVDDPESMVAYARHGYEFLRDYMWDKEHGGFYTLVDRQGNPSTENYGRIIKQSYGNAFAIYALAAYAAASGDRDALKFATETFEWLDGHAYDPVHGGYFNYMERDGTPLTDGLNRTPPKDQNSSIHLLEAFTELYHICPNPTVGVRLEELLELIRDTIRVDPGYLTLYSTADWKPVSYRDSTEDVRSRNYRFDHVSFGHDVETAFLLLEASDALALEDDTLTLKYAKQMVDHALATGWDGVNGGFYDGGYYLSDDAEMTILRDTKNWWAQAEGLNSLMIMAKLFPDERDKYLEYFMKLWDYIKTHQIDQEYNGWFEWGQDTSPQTRQNLKGNIWKTNYHDGRSMMALIYGFSDNNWSYRPAPNVEPCD